MALKLFPSPIPPPAAVRASPIKRPTSVASMRASASFQMKSNEAQIPQAVKPINGSRRDMIQYATANALVGIAFLFMKPAEARVSRLESKKKAMEKLEKLREKSGKPKAEAPLPLSSAPGEKKSPTLPLPPLGGRVGRMVEAVLSNM